MLIVFLSRRLTSHAHMCAGLHGSLELNPFRCTYLECSQKANLVSFLVCRKLSTCSSSTGESPFTSNSMLKRVPLILTQQRSKSEVGFCVPYLRSLTWRWFPGS